MLYDATARPIHAYLVAFTGNQDIADDVLQETYVRFFSAIRQGCRPKKCGHICFVSPPICCAIGGVRGAKSSGRRLRAGPLL